MTVGQNVWSEDDFTKKSRHGPKVYQTGERKLIMVCLTYILGKVTLTLFMIYIASFFAEQGEGGGREGGGGVLGLPSMPRSPHEGFPHL